MPNESIQDALYWDSSVSDITRQNIETLQQRIAKIFSRDNFALNNVAITSNFTATYKNSVIFADSTSGNITVTLAPANSWGSNKTPMLLLVKTVSVNSLYVAPDSADTLSYWDGTTLVNVALGLINGTILLVSDGANKWWAIEVTLTANEILNLLLSVDGTGSGIDADLLDGQHGAYYLPASSYTAADVLTKIKTVDGAASGLDADLLDGQSGTYYLAASEISYGTYTPTISSKVNISTSSAQRARYSKVGSIVTVYGQVTITATAAGAISFKLSLPVSSSFGDTFDLLGLCKNQTGPGLTNYVGHIQGEAAATRVAVFAGLDGSGINDTIQYHFNYLVA